MFFSCVVCYIGSCLCDELITRSDESYRVCVCGLEIYKKKGVVGPI